MLKSDIKVGNAVDRMIIKSFL